MWTDRYTFAPAREHLGPVPTVAARLRVLSAVAAVTPGATPSLATELASLSPVRLERDAYKVETRMGHDVAALLAVVRAHTGSDLVGYGLTSSNIVDTAQALQLRALGLVLVVEAYEAARAINNGDNPNGYQVSRTHGRAAEHGELRVHRRVWADRILHATDALASVQLPGQLAGPTGRYAVLDFTRATEALRLLGLPDPQANVDQAVSREHLLRWCQAVSGLATACAHFATQVRLAVTRDEVIEPTGVDDYHGSSSMPHKRNPTRSERIVGLERVVRANVGAIAESVVWWDQRDLTASSVERVVVGTIAELTGFILTETRSIAAGLVWDERVLRAGGATIAGRSSNEALWSAVVDGAALESAYDELRDAHDDDPFSDPADPVAFPD